MKKLLKKTYLPSKNAVKEACEPIREALLEVGRYSFEKMDKNLEDVKKIFPETWKAQEYKMISEKGANNVKKHTVDVVLKTATKFSIQRQLKIFEEMKAIPEAFPEASGKAKLKMILDYIEQSEKDLKTIHYDIFNNDIDDNYLNF